MKLQTDAGKDLADRAKLKIPVLGGILMNLAVARFCRVLGTLLGNGVPILKSLEISGTAAGNRLLRDSVSDATEKKIDLPESWVRGLLEVQSALSLATTRLDVSPAFLAEIVSRLEAEREKHGPRSMRFQLSPGEAVEKGTRQIAGALFASTVTSVAIFVPVLFMDGIEGQLFQDLALTIAVAVSASFLIAVTVLPRVTRIDCWKELNMARPKLRLTQTSSKLDLRALPGLSWNEKISAFV